MRRIAVIGSGISGLTCAYLLDKQYDVTVFEKNDYVGGHTATVDIQHLGKSYIIDTGFIVFNDQTYPHFNHLLSHLNVGRQATEMSFSVHNRLTRFEYNGRDLNALFAQRSNLFKPKFWRFMLDIVRFNRLCKTAFQQGAIEPETTLGDFLNKHHFCAFFRQHYILPMGAAIWSTTFQEVESFELKFFVQFFYHHGLLDIINRPQWYVIPNGSRSYVDALLAKLSQPVITHANIQQVTRSDAGVHVTLHNGNHHLFDDVIFACHSDEALKLLADATTDERDVLSGIPYSRNEVVLHTDTRLLPDNKRAWASWNYRVDDKTTSPSCVTYNMNILQGFHSDHTFCVTLNQSDAIRPEHVIENFVYHHPVLNEASVRAQKKRHLICGHHGCHFVGAYWYNGFHEDGVRSALDVAKRFGQSL